MYRLAAALLATAFAFVLTGCSDEGGSGSGTGTTSPAATSSPADGAGGDAVAWAEEVCKSVEGHIGALSQSPDIDTSNPQRAKDSMAAYLDNVAEAMDSMATGIKDAGPPPVDNGQQVLDQAVTGLEEAHTTVTNAKTTIEQAPTNDRAAFQQAFTKAGQDLQQLGELESLETLETNPELRQAFDEAPTCQKLDEQTGGSTSSAPTS